MAKLEICGSFADVRLKRPCVGPLSLPETRRVVNSEASSKVPATGVDGWIVTDIMVEGFFLTSALRRPFVRADENKLALSESWQRLWLCEEKWAFSSNVALDFRGRVCPFVELLHSFF